MLKPHDGTDTMVWPGWMGQVSEREAPAHHVLVSVRRQKQTLTTVPSLVSRYGTLLRTVCIVSSLVRFVGPAGRVAGRSSRCR